jgi:L-ascorbate metabolism protein UlaG (beta-lactamase superfamily)
MEITWLGHSSFLLEDSKGRTLLTDPFDESVGYNVYDGEANVVTISHHHFDHDYLEKVKGNPHILDKVGFFNECDIDIVGVPSYHDNVKGAKRGENVIYVFKMDDYRICHLGDLGHILTLTDADQIGHVDVLLIPVGGNYTIDGKEATAVCKLLNPHIVIPMHYKTPSVNFPLEGVETFLTHMENGDRVPSATLKLEDELEGDNIVKILNYSH